MSRTIREARSVGADRAFAWYSEAMRLFKRHPLRLAGLALVVFLGEIVLSAIPTVGLPATKVVVPLLACSLLYATLAVDRGERPRFAHLAAPFAAPLQAIAAVIVAGLAVFAVEWLVGWQVGGVNLLAATDLRELPARAVIAIYASGVAVSLPLTLVPMLALFEGAGTREAFATSAAAFFKNMPAFLLYGALSVALLGLAFVTLGLALLVVLPLWAASSFAAWKDLYGIA
jgi:uncharacterized membrane protein